MAEHDLRVSAPMPLHPFAPTVVIAPDSYKGSLTAPEVAVAMEQGLRRVWPAMSCIRIPIADGGEGTVEAILHATAGERIEARVTGPTGQPVRAFFGLLPPDQAGGRTAVIEMAAASGLPLVPDSERNPLTATTYGTGELLRAALERGATRIVVGIGGSATNDGGAGMAQALGARLLDSAGNELPQGGAALARLHRIDPSGLDPRLSAVEVVVACDVTNPLCGPAGASAVYGPQKGATAAMVAELDAALAVYANALRRDMCADVANAPGAGAAGGLGAGLMAFARAALRPGVGMVLEICGFDSVVASADLVVTGEGRTDSQTAFGKAPVGVAKAAKAANPGVVVVCLSGSLSTGASQVLAEGIDALAAITPGPMQLTEAIAAGAALVADAAERVAMLIHAGLLMRSRL